jgi:cytochrome c oxidase subunit 2
VIPPAAPSCRVGTKSSKPRIFLAVTGLLVLSGCNYNFGLPESVTTQGDEVTKLWRIFTSTALVIGILVWGLILWSVVRYRRRSDALPKQTLFNIPVEIVYTTLPLVVVAFLFTATMRTTAEVNALSADPDLTVEVTGFQWQWRFNYPEHGIDIVGQTGRPAEMVLPEGATVRVVLSSTDVIHAFWLPEFLIKRDAIPGRVTQFDMQVTRSGTFDSGRCAEYCGLNHDDMIFTVKAVPQAEFDSWAAAQGNGGDA